MPLSTKMWSEFIMKLKRAAAAAAVMLLCLSACGQKADDSFSAAETFDTPVSEQSYSEVSSNSSNTESVPAVSDSDKKKNTSSVKSTDSDTKSSATQSKKSSSASSKATSSGGSTQTQTQVTGGTYDLIQNVPAENVQQAIIEQPPIMTEPEPESTYANEYEEVDTKVIVDDSWFDDCVIMGDSLTVGLSMYNDAYGVFGNAKFVCAASLGYGNSQWDLYRPGNVHPYYRNQKILLEDAPSVTGANKAIITLGMNDIGVWGIDNAIEYARSLVGKIRAKTPDIKIYLQTVTPMLYGSQKASLNNYLIREFNSRLETLADELGCGFLNSYSAFADSNGNLPYYLCSDPGALGLHFNFEACAIWTNFIKANIATAYPGDEIASDIDTATDTDTEIENTDTELSDTDIETDTETDSVLNKDDLEQAEE